MTGSLPSHYQVSDCGMLMGRERGADAGQGWRNELYMVYAPPQSSAIKHDPTRSFSNGVFPLERAACAVFGFATFGVHLTGDTTNSVDL